MEKVVFLDRQSLNAKVRKPSFAHDWEEFEQTLPDQVVARLAGATIAITNKVPIRKESLEQLPALKLIAVAATGYDVIDLSACKEKMVSVANIRNYAVNTVPEHTFALILALKRNLAAYRDDVLAGRWQNHDQFCFFDHRISDLRDSTIGIFGEGVLGQGTARIAKGFGMNVLFADHPPPKADGVEFTNAEEVLKKIGHNFIALSFNRLLTQFYWDGAIQNYEKRCYFNKYCEGRIGERRGLSRCPYGRHDWRCWI